MVKDTLNPFDENIDKETLYNLGTGEAYSFLVSKPRVKI